MARARLSLLCGVMGYGYVVILGFSGGGRLFNQDAERGLGTGTGSCKLGRVQCCCVVVSTKAQVRVRPMIDSFLACSTSGAAKPPDVTSDYVTAVRVRFTRRWNGSLVPIAVFFFVFVFIFDGFVPPRWFRFGGFEFRVLGHRSPIPRPPLPPRN